jgi:two-component system, LuxR family, sensor kinase FixL
MLGLMQLFSWFKSQRSANETLALAVIAFAMPGVTLCEWLLMNAQTSEQYLHYVRWTHAPGFVMLMGMVGFVWFYFRTGTRWLAYTVIGLRSLILILNFGTPGSIGFKEITSLKKVLFLGQEVSIIGQAVSNPLNRLTEVSVLFFLWYAIDASMKVWRTGGGGARRKALIVGVGIVFFLLIAGIHSNLIHAQIINSPYIISLAFFGILLSMAHEISHDVLGASRLAERLKQAQEQTKLAADAANLALWTWDIPNDRIWVTESGLSMYGLKKGPDVTIGHFFEALHEQDRERVRLSITRAIKNGTPFAESYRVVRSGAEVLWISAIGKVETDSKGSPTFMRGISIDITTQRRAEERTALVVEASPNSIIMVNHAAQIILVNRQAEIVFGYAREEMLGQSIEMLIPSRFRDGHPALHQHYLMNPESRPMGAGRSLTALRKDGSELPVEVGLNPIETEDGRFVLASIVDVSKRMQQEKENAQKSAELAHLSRVSLLGQLAGSLAHELNQPLAIILSNAEAAEQMLEQGGAVDVKELREILKDIISEDLRAGGVIQSLRKLLKRGEVRLEPLSVNEVILNVLRLVQGDLNARKIVVHKELSADPPLVKADQIQLQQVVLNLILNACDAMEEASPKSRVLRLTSSASERAVRVSVYDNGTGLPNEDPESVFRAFSTTKDLGLGLGLSICRSIVAAHQGSIWCENLEAGGAVFHVEINLTDSESP